MECNANVNNTSLGSNNGEDWEIVFAIHIDQGENSSGKFEYDATVLENGEQTMKLRRSFYWDFKGKKTGKITDYLHLTVSEELDSVEVDTSTIECYSE